MNKKFDDAGHFSLFPLFTFAAQHPAPPPFAGIVGKREGDQYAMAVEKLLNDARVPRKGGWYVLGKFSDAGFFKPLAVGRASLGKTSDLFARLRDELLEERTVIFTTIYGEYHVAEAAKKLFKDRAKKTGKGRYGTGGGVQHNLRKAGAHFVMWATAPGGTSEMTNKVIRLVETVLIDRLRVGYDGKRPWVEKKLTYNEVMEARPFVEELLGEISGILGEK